METPIRNAAKGNPIALKYLYDSNKLTVYYLSKALLRNSKTAACATTWALKTSLQAIIAGNIHSEEAFRNFTITQAAEYCRKEIIETNAGAFHTPVQEGFCIPQINKENIGKYAGPLAHYLNGLPVLQRFVFVLRYVGNMSVKEITDCIGLDTIVIDRVIEAEPKNLSQIYRAVKEVGGSCTPPIEHMLKNDFESAISVETLPATVESEIQAYIASVSEPYKNSLKSRRKSAAVIAAVLLVCGLFLINLFICEKQEEPVMNAVSTESTQATVETVAQETEYTEPFNVVSDKSDTNSETPDYYADIIIENYGTITVKLNKDAAPITVNNFISLAESGFYDGLTFHRIMEGFMMQGGDPNGDGTGGSDKTIRGEFADNGSKNSLSHTRGAISMARSNDYNSASSQFFIVHEDSTFLDGQYAVFGYVTEGIEVVDMICTASEPTDNNGTILPENQPVITSINIRTITHSNEIVAQVKEVGNDGTLLLHLYALESANEDYVISDYTAVDLDKYAYAFNTMEYTIDEETSVKIVEDGKTTISNILEISAGDMIIICNDEDNVKNVFVYKRNISIQK